MSMTKGTPLSSQIIWLEERVKELEAICLEQKNELISIKRGQYFKENKKLQERVEELKDQVQYKQNTIDALTTMCNRLQNQTGNSGLESNKIENILIDSLDARYRKQVEKMSYSNEGIYTAKRGAAVYLIEELVDEVIKSSYDDNQIKLAYAIELLKRNQS
jgi:predicted RNase H-like nuclease (RuvC/YqgF family)